jgi:hypothetical protein
MKEDSPVIHLRQPDEIDDPLTSILRSGARQLLAQAVEMEADAFLAEMKETGSCPMVATVWCATVTDRSGRSRRGSARWRCPA